MPPTIALLSGALTDICATGGTLDPVAVFLGLYAGGPSVVPPATAADFTLPDATDMPAVALGAWGAYHILLDGSPARDATNHIFRLPDATNAFSAVGWYLADAAVAGNILDYGAFTAPIPMPDQFHTISIVYRVVADANGIWHAEIVIDG